MAGAIVGGRGRAHCVVVVESVRVSGCRDGASTSQLGAVADLQQ